MIKNGPKKNIKIFDKHVYAAKKFIRNIKDKKWSSELIQVKKNYFEKYYKLLEKIQNYYAIAVPLTNYCEKELITRNVDYLKYAVPLKSLDIGIFEKELRKLYSKKSADSIKKFIDKFSWINTSYKI